MPSLLQKTALLSLLPATIAAWCKRVRTAQWGMPLVLLLSLLHHDRRLQGRLTLTVDVAVNHAMIAWHARRVHRRLRPRQRAWPYGALVYAFTVHYVTRRTQKSDYWHTSVHGVLGAASLSVILLSR